MTKNSTTVGNDLAVPSLFSANCTTDDVKVLNQTIRSRPGTTMIYSGPVLSADDMNVLKALSDLSRGAPSSTYIFFLKTNLTELLEKLVWPVHTSSRDRLNASLLRLTRAHINFKEFGGPTGKRVVWHMYGSLLGTTTIVENNDDRKHSISTSISLSMLKLCEEDVGVPWTQRMCLTQSS